MKVAFFGLAIVAMASAGTLRSHDMEAIIQQVNSAQSTWKAGHNFAPDIPLGDIGKLMGTIISANRFASLSTQFVSVQSNSSIVLPEEFDAREHWPECPSLSYIPDQGSCGSCWAVAGAAAFSDRLCIASNGTFTEQLSAQHLLSCCEGCRIGCKGGFPDYAWQYFVDEGLVTGGDFESETGCVPYSMEPCEHRIPGPRPQCLSLPTPKVSACQSSCTNSNYSRSFKSDIHKAKNWYALTTVEAIMEDIFKYGSVEAAFSVYADLIAYKSGVYQHITGDLVGGHAVRVIGWGTENGTPYWLVANSWNTDWGNDGFFKIIRGTDDCGFESQMVAGQA